MTRNYQYVDSEYAAALAATAFSIHSLKESSLQQQNERELARPAAEALRRGLGPAYRTPASARPLPLSREVQKPEGVSRGHRYAETKADAWEKAQLVKIKKRYEKLHSAILAWENEKKMKAKQRMDERKNTMEHTRANITQRYQTKLARIEDIARGARQQAEEKRKYEESVVKERAKRMRATGETPVTCFCC